MYAWRGGITEKPILKDTKGMLSFKLQKAIRLFRMKEWTLREECGRDTKKTRDPCVSVFLQAFADVTGENRRAEKCCPALPRVLRWRDWNAAPRGVQTATSHSSCPINLRPAPQHWRPTTVSAFTLWRLGRRGTSRRGEGQEGAIGRICCCFLEYLVESSLALKQRESHFPFLSGKLCSFLKYPYLHSLLPRFKQIKTQNDFFGILNSI